MPITPLYTKEELDEEIAQAKKDRAAARRAIQYSKGANLQVQRERLDQITKDLKDLQRERMRLDGVFGPQAIQMRVSRG